METQEIIKNIKELINKITSVKDSKIKLTLEQNIISLEEKIQHELICLQKKIIELQETNIKNNHHYAQKLEEIHNNNKRTYANVLGDNKNFVNTGAHNPEQKHAIIITSKNTLKAEDIKIKIQKNINLTKIKVGVNGVKKIGEQKLLISCQKKEDAEKLTEEINKVIGKEILAEEIKKKKPCLMLKRLQCQLTEEEIIDGIVQQNEGLTLEDKNNIKLIKELKNKYNEGKDNDTTNYIIETTGKLRKTLLEKNKVNIKFQRVYIEDCNPLTQCYHCLKFGHTAQRCLARTQPPICPHCTKEHILSKCENKEQPPICNNCCVQNKRFNMNYSTEHRVDSMKCLYRQKMLQIARERIDYE